MPTRSWRWWPTAWTTTAYHGAAAFDDAAGSEGSGIGSTTDVMARLAASHFAHESGELLVSFHRRSAVLTYATGTATRVDAGPPARRCRDLWRPAASASHPTSSLTWSSGRRVVVELEQEHADCNLGAARTLAAALFRPSRRSADLR